MPYIDDKEWKKFTDWAHEEAIKTLELISQPKDKHDSISKALKDSGLQDTLDRISSARTGKGETEKQACPEPREIGELDLRKSYNKGFCIGQIVGALSVIIGFIISKLF